MVTAKDTNGILPKNKDGSKAQEEEEAFDAGKSSRTKSTRNIGMTDAEAGGVRDACTHTERRREREGSEGSLTSGDGSRVHENQRRTGVPNLSLSVFTPDLFVLPAREDGVDNHEDAGVDTC